MLLCRLCWLTSKSCTPCAADEAKIALQHLARKEHVDYGNRTGRRSGNNTATSRRYRLVWCHSLWKVPRMVNLDVHYADNNKTRKQQRNPPPSVSANPYRNTTSTTRLADCKAQKDTVEISHHYPSGSQRQSACRTICATICSSA